MTEKKRWITSVLKEWSGTLVIAIPLIVTVITGSYQYRQYVHQKLDENFRNIVKELSSENIEERLAAATNMGTFIKKGILSKGKYYNEAVDILINRVSIELDFNVLNAIKGSLQKISKREYREVIQKLLDINRNLFIQDYPLKSWSDGAKKEYEDGYSKIEDLCKKNMSKADRLKLDNLKKETKRKWEISYDREKSYRELALHTETSANFITFFLEVTKLYPVKKLIFFQNNLNYVRWIGLTFSKVEFERAALSRVLVDETTFDELTIKDTIFTFSDIIKSSFVDCEITASLFDQITSLRGTAFSNSKFKDVFFAGSDLTDADFKGAKGLLPIYFYEAKNIDKDNFDDPEFKIKVDKITEDEFKGYVNNSELADYRKEELFRTLDELKKKEPAKATIEPFETLQEPKETK